ncbi:hypothetical protein [Xanthobacter sediminis]
MGNVSRRWWPAEMEDEYMPQWQTDPSGWLTIEDGKIIFGRLHDDDANAHFDGVEVRPHDTVKLVYTDMLGKKVVEFRADGTYVVHGEEPEDYNHCWEQDDPENCGSSLADLADIIRDNCTLNIEFSRYGHEHFVVEMIDGRPGLRSAAAEVRHV